MTRSSYVRISKLTSVFHHPSSVGSKQLCALAHLEDTCKAFDSYWFFMSSPSRESSDDQVKGKNESHWSNKYYLPLNPLLDSSVVVGLGLTSRKRWCLSLGLFYQKLFKRLRLVMSKILHFKLFKTKGSLCFTSNLDLCLFLSSLSKKIWNNIPYSWLCIQF